MSLQRVFVAGHRGMVGSAVVRLLGDRVELVTASRGELDLRDDARVRQFLGDQRVDAVVDAAAVVGGIEANRSHPYPFLMDNLRIQNALIQSAVELGIRRFVFLGSSCIYPKLADQPLKEDYLLTGPLEPTNQWYAVAKIAGVKAVEAVRQQYGLPYVSLMPTNLYGPGDNFDATTSHVLPAIMRKLHEAKRTGGAVELWGTGSPLREFLHVDDLARAVAWALSVEPADDLYNVGSGQELSIRDLAEVIARVVGYEGEVRWDARKPDGTPRKLLDSSRLHAQGWRAEVPLEEGIRATYAWYVANPDLIRSITLG
jgi:GDP-L-fucose synthase